MTLRPLRMLVLLFLTIPLQSCAIRPTVAQRSPDSPIKAVPCTELPVLAFHAPDTAETVRAWLAGALPDPQNVLDTPDTVKAIRRANAARGAICGP